METLTVESPLTEEGGERLDWEGERFVEVGLVVFFGGWETARRGRRGFWNSSFDLSVVT